MFFALWARVMGDLLANDIRSILTPGATRSRRVAAEAMLLDASVMAWTNRMLQYNLTQINTQMHVWFQRYPGTPPPSPPTTESYESSDEEEEPEGDAMEQDEPEEYSLDRCIACGRAVTRETGRILVWNDTQDVTLVCGAISCRTHPW